MRRAAALLTTVVIGFGTGGCTAGNETTTIGPGDEEPAPAPSKADVKAAQRAWEAFMARTGRLERKRYAKSIDCSAECPGLTAEADAGRVEWRDCVDWVGEEPGFCAVGSLEIRDRTSGVVESSEIRTFSGTVRKVGGRWVASEDE